MSTNVTRQTVAVVVKGQTLLVAVSDILEILSPVPCTPIPRVKTWFLGLASSSGNIMPVCDLGGFLFGDAEFNYESSRLLLIQSDADVFALRVDEVLGLRKYNKSQFINNLSEIPAVLIPFVNEVVKTNAVPLPVLVPELIVSSDSFLNIKHFEK